MGCAGSRDSRPQTDPNGERWAQPSAPPAKPRREAEVMAEEDVSAADLRESSTVEALFDVLVQSNLSAGDDAAGGESNQLLTVALPQSVTVGNSKTAATAWT
mmetsp:Transcript_61527/g.164767  ORF Transcript_61527/g.164767 Transcript_61527/m.164767 type:complete len:102 (+) Transcript_61527:55-360(+)